MYDMAVGSTIPTVFGGPADRVAYGETIDFVARRVPLHKMTDDEKRVNELFQVIRDIRGNFKGTPEEFSQLQIIVDEVSSKFAKNWLLKMELLELAYRAPRAPDWRASLLSSLQKAATDKPNLKESIENGLKLAASQYQ
jgi:phenylalanine-4-hydroxylase